MIDPGLRDFVEELFGQMGHVTLRHFFGGAGVYQEGTMFAMITDGTIYLKVDATLKADLAVEGSGPFLWTPRSGPKAGQTLELGYWRLPETALDDPDEAAQWGRPALSAAEAVARRKPPKTPRALSGPR